jgi:MFS transporter, DHA1 family, multidrug resistance protein
MASISSLVALSIDTMLPALPQIGAALNAEPQQTQWIIAFVVLGLGFGQLVFGPMADAIGRKKTILIGLSVFAVGSLVSLFSTSIEIMLLGRVLQGFGVAGPRIASIALIRDQFVGEHMARVMSFITMVFILVPMIAPVVGQAILLVSEWQGIFVFFLFFALIIAIWFGLRQPETLALSKRRKFTWRNIVNASLFVLSHKVVMTYTVTAGLVFGAFLAYVSNSQLIFQSIYPLGEWFPLCFALVALSIGVASFINAKLVLRFGMRRLSFLSLKVLVGLATLLTVLLLINDQQMHLYSFMSLMMSMAFCIGILFGNLNALAMQPLAEFAGLGAAVIGFVSNIMAALIAVLISSYMLDSLQPIALGFLICGILAMILFVKIKNIDLEKSALINKD